MDIRNITLFLVFILNIIHINAQIPEPTFDWANKIGNSGWTFVRSITLDEVGSMYVSGSYASTNLTLNGITITPRPLGGNWKFLSKYDTNGNGEWIKTIPENNMATGYSRRKILAAHGDFYMLVLYNMPSTYQMEFDGIQMPPTTAQGGDALIKLNADGVIQWIKSIDRYGLPSGNLVESARFCNSIYLGEEGNIHLLSTFQTKATFNEANFNLTNPDSTQIDAFHAVYDTSGNLLSAVRFGENNDVHSEGTHFFDMDKQNNTYRYVDDENTLLKYNPQGDTLWTKELSISGGIFNMNAMKVDPWGNIFYAGGRISGTITLEDSVISPINGSNRHDAVLFKLNAEDGSLAWIKQYDHNYCNYYEVMDIDDIGNIYLAGRHQFCNSFGQGGNNGGHVLFTKYTNNGEQLWEKVITTTEPSIQVNDITQANNGGNVFIGGSFRESINFGNGNTLTDNATLSGNPANRAFIAKYGLCNNTPQPQISAVNTGFCEGDSVLLSVASPNPTYSYLWSRSPHDTTSSIYVKESGNYSVFAIDSTGECYAQSQEIYIEEHPETTTTDEITTCDSLTWIDGNTYTSDNNTATHTLTSAAGCDSLVVLDLTVNYSNTAIDEITACNSYTWIDGNSYMSSNSTATHILTSVAGCDSLITLDLTINTVDTSITQDGATLTATTSADAYEWIDCENNMPTGETSQTFTPVQNGDYAVILTSVEGCVATSACYTITTVGIENNLSLNDQITVYPNPANGKLYIETDLNIKELIIFDLQGKKLLTSNTKEIDILGLPTSVYILEITLLDNEQWRTKVIKE